MTNIYFLHTLANFNQGNHRRTVTQKPITKNISFHADNLRLTGTLHLPGNHRPPVVIGCHGLLSNRHSPKQIALADACCRNNMAYFRFDHRGCGESQGEFAKVTSLEARCKDLFCAIETINHRTDTGDRIGLFGSSMGGTVCLAVAGQLGLAPLVTVAAPIQSRVIKNIQEGSNASHVTPIFLDSHQNHFDISEMLGSISGILIFHGDADKVVPVAHARKLYKMAHKPKKLIIQNQGDHPMSNENHQQDFIRETLCWFKTSLFNYP